MWYSVHQGLGYAAGKVLNQIGSDLHLLLYYASSFGIVQCVTQVITFKGIGGLQLHDEAHSVPGAHNGLLRFCTVVGVEPQAGQCYGLFIDFHLSAT